MARVLVAGGAGYIGSHMVKRLLEERHEVVVLDDFSKGHRDAVVGGTLVEGSTGDTGVLDALFSRHAVDVVMHFASYIEVGESMREPERYYHNNVDNTLNLLSVMARHRVKRFVYSSSAAVYGDIPPRPVTEDQPCVPANPYGESKWIIEQALRDRDAHSGLKSVSLRYFNAAGADPDGRLGERHEPESHLIPLVLQAASGRRKGIQVFGRDYTTPDGTCVRDYIHVCDLCQAHILAMQHLLAGGGSRVYNVGNSSGFSVLEVIDAARRVTGRPIAVEDAPRRRGDAPVLVADTTRIMSDLGWRPSYPRLETIIGHAWNWELTRRREAA